MAHSSKVKEILSWQLPSEIVTDSTPVEHPEGTRFNEARGVNLAVTGVNSTGQILSQRIKDLFEIPVTMLSSNPLL